MSTKKVRGILLNGGLVQSLRKAKGWSQEQLALQIGASTHTVGRAESGKTAISVELANAIADALDVPLKRLIVGHMEEPKALEPPMKVVTSEEPGHLVHAIPASDRPSLLHLIPSTSHTEYKVGDLIVSGVSPINSVFSFQTCLYITPIVSGEILAVELLAYREQRVPTDIDGRQLAAVPRHIDRSERSFRTERIFARQFSPYDVSYTDRLGLRAKYDALLGPAKPPRVLFNYLAMKEPRVPLKEDWKPLTRAVLCTKGQKFEIYYARFCQAQVAESRSNYLSAPHFKVSITYLPAGQNEATQLDWLCSGEVPDRDFLVDRPSPYPFRWHSN